MGLFRTNSAKKIKDYFERTEREWAQIQFEECFGFLPRKEKEEESKPGMYARFRNFLFDDTDLGVEHTQLTNAIGKTILSIRSHAMCYNDPQCREYTKHKTAHGKELQKFYLMRKSAVYFYPELAYLEKIELPEQLEVLPFKQDVPFVNQEQGEALQQQPSAEVIPLFTMQSAE